MQAIPTTTQPFSNIICCNYSVEIYET